VNFFISRGIDQIKQAREGVAQIETAAAAMANVELAAHLGVEQLGVDEVRILPIDHMPCWGFQATFTHCRNSYHHPENKKPAGDFRTGRLFERYL
jgi:hypothetical protein